MSGATLNHRKAAITIVDAGSISGIYNLDLASKAETWVNATLAGDVSVALSNLIAGAIVRFFVTEDSTGGRTFEVTDGAVSVPADVNDRPNASSVVVVETLDGEDLVVTGSGPRGPRALVAGYTLTASDPDRLLSFNTAGNVLLSVPFDPGGGTFNVGDEIRIVEAGAGQVRVGADAGVSVTSVGGLRGVKRGGRGVLTNVGVNLWVLSGELSATYTLDPTSIAALVGFYKADALVLNDGDPVAVWTDSSGVGNDAAQPTAAKKPTFKTAGRNGLPCVHLDGVDDWMTVAGIHNNVAARTIFFVGQGSASGGVAWELSDTAAMLSESAGVWTYKNNQGGAGVSAGGAISNLTLITVRFNNAGSADIYRNGVFVANFDPNDGYQSGGLQLAIGAAINDVAHWPGDACEMLVYDAALSDANRGNVEAYLLAKWGLA